jgi:hypothetical protein
MQYYDARNKNFSVVDDVKKKLFGNLNLRTTQLSDLEAKRFFDE